MTTCKIMWQLGFALSLTLTQVRSSTTSSSDHQELLTSAEEMDSGQQQHYLSLENNLQETSKIIENFSNETSTSSYQITSINSKSNRYRHRRNNKETPAVTETTTNNASVLLNITHHVDDTNKSKDAVISDKEIIIIVISTSIGLVICLLSAALFVNKCYLNKTREGNGGYQGVKQKDTPDGNSPTTEEQQQTTTMMTKGNGVRGQTNMFAQIDETDEADSCPSSPIIQHTHHHDGHQQDNGQQHVKIEAKPLLPSSQPMSTAPTQLDNCTLGTMLDNKCNENDVKLMSTPPVTEVRVEVAPPQSSSSNSTTPERLYCRTGLSQSDYSLSSFTSVNPSYRYGNQVGYMCGYYGYPSVVTSPNDYYHCIGEDVMLLAVTPSSGYVIASSSTESGLDINDEAVTSSNQMFLGLPVDVSSSASVAMDNGSEYSLVVNVDDSRRCDDDDDGDITGNEDDNEAEFMGQDAENLSDVIDNSYVEEELSETTGMDKSIQNKSDIEFDDENDNLDVPMMSSAPVESSTTTGNDASSTTDVN